MRVMNEQKKDTLLARCYVDKEWKYVKADDTDVARTFQRIRLATQAQWKVEQEKTKVCHQQEPK